MKEKEVFANSLATEIMKELKLSARRWFVAFCIMVVLEVATVAGFMWYISLPTEESTISQGADDIGGNLNQIIGDDNR